MAHRGLGGDGALGLVLLERRGVLGGGDREGPASVPFSKCSWPSSVAGRSRRPAGPRCRSRAAPSFVAGCRGARPRGAHRATPPATGVGAGGRSRHAPGAAGAAHVPARGGEPARHPGGRSSGGRVGRGGRGPGVDRGEGDAVAGGQLSEQGEVDRGTRRRPPGSRPTVAWSGRRRIGRPSGGTWTAPVTIGVDAPAGPPTTRDRSHGGVSRTPMRSTSDAHLPGAVDQSVAADRAGPGTTRRTAGPAGTAAAGVEVAPRPSPVPRASRSPARSGPGPRPVSTSVDAGPEQTGVASPPATPR